MCFSCGENEGNAERAREPIIRTQDLIHRARSQNQRCNKSSYLLTVLKTIALSCMNSMHVILTWFRSLRNTASIASRAFLVSVHATYISERKFNLILPFYYTGVYSCLVNHTRSGTIYSSTLQRYNPMSLYGETPPKKGYLFWRLLNKRVGIS